MATVAGHNDQLAARTTPQLLEPGAIRQANQLPTTGERHTTEQAVFAELAIGISTYPWQRRPGRIAANPLLDSRQRPTPHRTRDQREHP